MAGRDQALVGKTAFVTGGSGAIGSAVALRLVQDGAAVLLMARDLGALAEARSTILDNVPSAIVETFSGNARDPDNVEEALGRAWGIQQSLDFVVPTVGQGEMRPILMHDAASFSDALQQNIVSAFLAIRYGVPLMRPGGSIVCISSIVAHKPASWMAGYSTAKAGLEGLVRAAAEEFGSAGIRVNAVRPGLTRSKLRAAMFADEELLARFTNEIPLGRAGEPRDIAEAVRYLAGEEASWVTGQSLAVDGGSELRRNPDLTDRAEAQFGKEKMDAYRRGKTPRS